MMPRKTLSNELSSRDISKYFYTYAGATVVVMMHNTTPQGHRKQSKKKDKTIWVYLVAVKGMFFVFL